MSTPEWTKNYFSNDSIVKMAGFMPELEGQELEEAHMVCCLGCSRDIEEMEFKRNNGICDTCAMTKEIK